MDSGNYEMGSSSLLHAQYRLGIRIVRTSPISLTVALSNNCTPLARVTHLEGPNKLRHCKPAGLITRSRIHILAILAAPGSQ